MRSRSRLACIAATFCVLVQAVATVPATASDAVPVDVHNFTRAESDLYFGRMVAEGGLGQFVHRREMASLDNQTVIRLNRDTLYSSAIFDLSAGPVTITLPDAGPRFLSLMVTNQDHYVVEVVYKPGKYRYTSDKVGTRYVLIAARVLANPNSPEDLKAAHAVQDALFAEQAGKGTWEAPNWDQESQNRIRAGLLSLGAFKATGKTFGRKNEVDPIDHLIGTAAGWGGNPAKDAMYSSEIPTENDGKTAYSLTVKDVPVDGFWSVTVYNEKGFFEKNEFDLYSVNNLTAKPNADGSFTVQFGGDRAGAPNWLPITPGWNYTVRMYRPRKPLLNGTWKFPDAVKL